MNAGDIEVNLELDDKHFRLTAREAGRVLRSLERQLGQVGKGVNALESHFSAFTTKLRHTVVTLMAVRFAAIDFYDAFIRLPRAILETSGEIERLTKLMEGLSSASDDVARKTEGAKNLQSIFDLARKAPFEVKSLADAFVKMKSGGLDPTNGSLNALVDSVAKFGGTSDTLHRASVAIQQMAGKGVISMEELRQQLGEAVPNAIRAMAIGTGMSIEELIKRISKGEVESTAALTRMFAVMRAMNSGAAREMMETWPGILARLKTEWQLFANEVAQNEFMPAIKEATKDIISFLQSPEMQQFAVDFGKNLGIVVDFFKSMTYALRENWELIKGIAIVGASAWGISKIYEFTKGVQGLTSHLRGPYLQTLANVRAQHQATYLDAASNAAKAFREAEAHRTVLKGAIDDFRRYKMASNGAYQDTARNHVWATNAAKAARQHAFDVLATQRALNAKTRAAQQAMQAVENLTFRTQAAAVAKRAFGEVLLAFGGWVGIAVTALTTLAIVLWNTESAADKTRRALERLENAKNGIASRDALDRDREELRLLKEKKKTFEELQNSTETPDDLSRLDSQRDYKDDLKKVEKEIADRELSIKLNERNIYRAAVAADFAMREREADDKIAQIQRASASEVQAINTAFADKIAAVKNNEVQVRRLREEYSEAIRKQQAIELAKEKQIIETIRTDLQDELKDRLAGNEKTAVEAIKKVIEKYNQRLDVINKQFISSQTIGTQTTFLKKTDNKDKLTKSDPLLDRLEEARGRMIEASAKLSEIEDEHKDFQVIYNRMLQKVDADLRAGKLNFPGDKNNDRKPIDRRKGLAGLSGADRKAAEEIANHAAQIELLDEQTKALTIAKQLATAKQQDFNAAMDRFGEINARQTPGMLQLERAIAAIKLKFSEGTKEAESFKKSIGEAFERQALTDAANFVNDLVPKTRALQAELLETERERQEASYQAEKKSLEDQLELLIKNIEARVRAEGGGAEQILKIRRVFNEYAAELAKKHARDTETPMRRLAREWNDVTKQMQEATARWAEQGVEAIVQFVKTGKFEFKSLVESILTDLLRIQIKKKIVGPLSDVIDGLGKKLGEVITGGGGGGGESLPLIGDFDFGAVFAANGGIMSRFGLNALRAYSNGGIANRPQMAIFGEGSQPEAYVPLPDGKNIPVRLQGAMPSVEVNVINQTGVAVDAQKGQPRFDGRQMVLDVVLTAASQPGGFRDGMRQAMR